MPRRGLTLVKPLLDLVMAAQEVQAVKAARQELGTSSYLRLNFTQPAAQQSAWAWTSPMPTAPGCCRPWATNASPPSRSRKRRC